MPISGFTLMTAQGGALPCPAQELGGGGVGGQGGESLYSCD